MKLPSLLRQCVVFVGAGFALATFQLPAVAATGRAPAEAQVNGLIVELRDAPSHVVLARERAQAQAQGGPTTLAQREAGRWKAVLGQPGVLAAGMALRGRQPVGARAQLLRFDQPLPRERAERIAAALATHADVVAVHLNARERRLANATNPPNDPQYLLQWWLQPMSGVTSWGVPRFLDAWILHETGNPSAVVAVLDTGITCHPDLGNMTPTCIGGVVLPGYDFVSDDSVGNDSDPGRDADPTDPGDWVTAAEAATTAFAGCDVSPTSSWHGTAQAGIIAGLTNNGVGVAAANWNGRVLPIRVAGKCGADPNDIVDGMLWAAGLPVCLKSDTASGICLNTSAELAVPRARIVNISFGGDDTCAAYQSTIDELRARGVVVVAAAGNEHNDNKMQGPLRPAKCSGVVGVVALNRLGFKSNYSNFGPELAASGIATVGGDDYDAAARWNALADTGIKTIGNVGLTSPGAPGISDNWGTSFSAPIVSGVVSLMLSVNATLTVDQIINGLRISARPHATSPPIANVAACSLDNPGRCLCTTTTCGAGILDAERALAYAANPSGYVAPILTPARIDTQALRDAASGGPDRPANPAPASSGGGGAMSVAWLLALLAATLVLAAPFSASASKRQPAPALRRARNRRPAARY